MNAVAAAVLQSMQGVAVPLKGVTARGRLTGLLFELTVEQTYENSGSSNIEAEYTFPVPHRAVLLGLEVRIGERELKAVAVRRQTAREHYEEAIDSGDSAVLLEQSGDGLFSLSLGNLMAGERAMIRYRYAELLDRSGDDVRLAVPTVIAPRYGAPAEHGVAPHQVLGVDLLAAYPFVLEIDVEGDMARAALSSPTHALHIEVTATGRRVRLAAGAELDRDFVLSVRGVQTRSTPLVAPDGDGYVALLSLDPRLEEAQPAPMALKVLVDCSGSMGGESIGCARRALTAILDRLDARDRLSITRFGSSVDHVPVRTAESVPATGVRGLFGGHTRRTVEPRGELAAATPAVLEWLRHCVRDMDANLGGTELRGALQATIAIPVPEAPVKDILLITDAEVWAVEAVLDEARRSGHRLFIVVVGAAPAEALGRQLAERTGGACEFVTPGEDAEAAIVRMFRRMREVPKHVARIDWPLPPAWEAPLPAALFAGDTLHLVAGFDRAPTGPVRVVVSGLAGGDVALEATLAAPVAHDVLPRVAAARRLALLPETEAAALAERYQLASRHTSFIVVQVREADGKATAPPELRAVPQMLAAGWGGTARLADPMVCGQASVFDLVQCPARPLFDAADRGLPRTLMSRPANAAEYGATFEFDLLDADGADAGTPQAIVAALCERLAAGEPLPAGLAGLEALGVPARVIDALRAIAHTLDPLGNVADLEARLVRVWIALMARSQAGSGLARAHLAALKGDVLGERGNRAIRSALARTFAGVTAERWSPQDTEATTP